MWQLKRLVYLMSHATSCDGITDTHSPGTEREVELVPGLSHRLDGPLLIYLQSRFRLADPTRRSTAST